MRFSYAMKNQKGFIIPVLILFSLVILGIISYFFSPKSINSVNVKIPSSLPTNPSTGWKLYKSDIFSFEYPSDYSIQKTDDSEMIVVEGPLNDNNVEQIYIDWRKNEYSDTTITNEISKLGKTDVIRSNKKIQLGVDLVVRISGKLGGSFSTGNVDTRVVLLDTKRNRLIRLDTNTPKNKFEKFDKILSTFKFID